MTISINAQFEKENLDKTIENEGHLMVSIKAEDEEFERTPVEVALVLDVSASMNSRTESGQSKIDALKEVARKIAENLTDKDKVSITTFSASSEVVLSSIEAGNKQAVLLAISKIHTVGNTNMSAGLYDGIEQITSKFEGVKRIMLLTDGLANAGIHDRDGLMKIAKGLPESSTLSTFAFGLDADQELLADMAKAGGGNNYYISNAQDMSNVFARELGGIVSCLAQNLEVTIKPSADNEIVEVLNDFTVEDKEGEAVIKAEDIYVGETKNILVKMKIGKANGKAKDRPFSLTHVDVSYRDIKQDKKVEETFNVKAKFVKPEEADEKAKLEIREQVELLNTSKMHQEAVSMANRGDFTGAQKLFAVGNDKWSRLKEAGSPMAKGMLQMNHDVSNNMQAHSYNHGYGAKLEASSKSAGRGRSGGDESWDKVYGTKAQADMSRSFDEQGTSPTIPPIPKSEPESEPKPERSSFSKRSSRS